MLKLINTDSKSGFRSLMRRLNYASYTRAAYWEKSSDFMAIDMDISVTTKGLEHILEISQLFFDYVKTIKAHEMNNIKFRETQMIQTVKYMYQDRQSLDTYLLNYLGKMSNNPKYDPSSFLVKNDLLQTFNATLYDTIIG